MYTSKYYEIHWKSIKSTKFTIEFLRQKKHGFKGKIHIEITRNNDYIDIKLTDNGTGILDTKKVMTPYFTTKRKGSGLGLPIVSKIINDHSGELVLSNNKKEDGVEILISLPVKSWKVKFWL